MITVFIDDTATPAQEQDVRDYCDRALLTNPNLNGASIAVLRDEYTWVDGADAIVGAQLLAEVQRIITGADAF